MVMAENEEIVFSVDVVIFRRVIFPVVKVAVFMERSKFTLNMVAAGGKFRKPFAGNPPTTVGGVAAVELVEEVGVKVTT